MNWPLVPLSAAMERIEAGRSPKAQDRPAKDDEFGVLKLSAISWGQFNPQQNKALLPNTQPNGCPTVGAGDLLISRANTTELVGAVVLVDRDYPNLLLSDKTLRLVPKMEVAHGPFLLHALRTAVARGHIERSATGTSFSMRNISQEKIASTPIPLPPLREQRRIAEILDKADALRVKRRAAIAQLDTLTQAIFLDMFGDPTTNPKGWPMFGLGKVTEFFAGSTLPTGSPFVAQDGGYFLLKVSDMNRVGNGVMLQSCAYWSEMPGPAACTCPVGSVVIPKRGGAIETNKKRITVRASVLDPNLMGIWPRPGMVELSFLYVWFLRLDLGSLTSGSSVPQLNKRDLKPLPIAVPPIDLQREFSRLLARIDALVAIQRTALAQADALFASLQHRAFRGEL